MGITSNHMISIVIGAYNEEKRIKNSVCEIFNFLERKKINHEIIVVNDGSTDKTNEVLIKMAAEVPTLRINAYEENRGKGYALRVGVLSSRGKLVLISDADLSTPIEEFEEVLPFIESKKSEIAIGSRGLTLSKIIRRQPWWRQGMGKIFNKLVKLIVLEDFNDTQCGIKLFEGGVARELVRELKTERFAFDVEILARAKKKGYRIVEVPVRWINSKQSKVNPVLDSLIMIRDLVRIRMALRSS